MGLGVHIVLALLGRGDVDASGRLPYTIGRRLEDYGPGAQVLYEHPDPSIPPRFLARVDWHTIQRGYQEGQSKTPSLRGQWRVL
jgi:hypothetical protein